VARINSRRFLRKGIPYTEAGRSVRYELGDVLEFMKSRLIEFEDD